MKPLKIIVNVALRMTILYFMAEILLNPRDPRFENKGQSLGGLIVILILTLLFPVFHFLKHKWREYPFWYDSLYIFVYWLDFAGNSFGLYENIRYFDKVPHFVSPGALAVIFRGAFGQTRLEGFGLANVIHILHEAEEWYGDKFFGTENVQGIDDTVDDLMAGIVGSIVFLALHSVLVERHRRMATRPKDEQGWSAASEAARSSGSSRPRRRPAGQVMTRARPR